MSRQQASQELAALASGFQSAQMVNTANAMNSLSAAIQGARSFSSVRPQLKQLYEGFELDWGSDQYRRKLFLALQKCTKFYLQRKTKRYSFTAYLHTFERHLIARRKAEDNIRFMIAFANQASTDEEKTIWLSLVYLLAVEGVYDQSARMLYMLLSFAYNQIFIQFRRTHQQTLDTIRTNIEGLIGKRKSNLVFSGWQHNLRNSIAHANFSYDSNSRRTRYQDFRPGTGIRSWGPRFISSTELMDMYYQRLEDVSTYLTFLLWLMIARDTVSRTL